MNRTLLLLILLTVAAVPFATADTIDLTHNNLGISGSIGTVNLTQQGSNVLVTITANSGFSLKLEGGQVAFNTISNITSAMIGPVTIVAGGQTYTGLGFHKLDAAHTQAGFNFSYALMNLKGPHGITSASSISFLISGVTVQQLEQMSQNNPYMWGVHFCVGEGTNCGPNTGFAQGNIKTVVPEPGTLSLLGTGMVGLAALMRRRLLGQ